MVNNNIRSVFIEEVRDIYSAENQIVNALPKMIEAADCEDLREAFETHLNETREQVKRLEMVFSMIGEANTEHACRAMHGLIQECEEVIQLHPKSALRDAALISKAQRIEHYEISAYGTLRTFAKELGFDDAASLFDESLEEEANADKTLNKIAEGGLLTSGVNTKANRGE